MTALDLITAYAVIPVREDVALFLEEAMKGEGWQSSKMVDQRRDTLEKSKLEDKIRSEREALDKILNLGDRWWQEQEEISNNEAPPGERSFDHDTVYV